MILHKNFTIDLGILENISREVGYANAKMNDKIYDKDGNESYDNKAIKEYEKLRAKQINFFTKMHKYYGKIINKQNQKTFKNS